MTAHEIIVQHFGPKFRGNALALGQWSDVFHPLVMTQWKLFHAGWSTEIRTNGAELIWAQDIGVDPHFVKLMAGHWVKTVTLQEIINQFPGPYDLLWIDVPEKNRVLWYTDQVQAAFRPADQTDRPFMCVIPEDGHNEAVEAIVRQKGYRFIHREGGYFFMGNP